MSSGTDRQIAENVNPFHSFWMAGFECSDKLNAFGNRVDLLAQTHHIEQIESDYEILKSLGIRTVREGIRWSRVEKAPYHYDWEIVGHMIRIGITTGVQQVWDLCHFGFPDDLTPLHPMFARRFAALCSSFIQFYRTINPHGQVIITPINEVSFLSWLGGEVRGTSPYCINLGWEVKYKLMQAYIEGIEAIKEIDDSVIIMPTEPMINVVAPLNCCDSMKARAYSVHKDQYQVYDMLTGAICPELRGKPEYIDFIGVNYYANNQWVVDSTQILHWEDRKHDRRWRSPQFLMSQIFKRYSKPLVLAETSHCADERPEWLEFITRECLEAVNNNIPLYGICWYPAIDRCDWDLPDHIHHSGLIGKDPFTNKRMLHMPTVSAFLKAQQMFQRSFSPSLTTEEINLYEAVPQNT